MNVRWKLEFTVNMLFKVGFGIGLVSLLSSATSKSNLFASFIIDLLYLFQASYLPNCCCEHRVFAGRVTSEMGGSKVRSRILEVTYIYKDTPQT